MTWVPASTKGSQAISDLSQKMRLSLNTLSLLYNVYYQELLEYSKSH